MTDRLPALAGRAVYRAAEIVRVTGMAPWPIPFPACDPLLRRLRVRLVPCNRKVTCSRCLRVLAALRNREA